MALSMEERRILAQIEVRLSEEDPRLAHRLSKLGQARRRRGPRIIAAVMVAVLALATAIGSAIFAVFW